MESYPYKILIVDDMQENLHDMLNCLFEGGYLNVLCARNGADALKVAIKEIPDLILLDWDMPGMCGIEVLEKLKADTETAHIPVIMATGAMLSARNLEHALAKGAVDYIAKPFERIELLARVKSTLESSGMLGTIQRQHQEIIAQKDSLERNEKRLRALLNASIEACILVEQDLIIEANSVFYSYTAYVPEDVIGQSFLSFLDEESRVMYAKNALQFGQSFSISILKKDGLLIPVEILTKQFEYNQHPVMALSMINLNQLSHLFGEDRDSELLVQNRRLKELTEMLNEYSEENRGLHNQLQVYEIQNASHNDFLDLLSTKLEAIKSSVEDESSSCRKDLQECIQSIRQNSYSGMWDEFKSRFSRLHPEFYSNLLNDFPGLTEKDLRLCSLIRLNVSVKELAQISNVLPDTIKVARKRMRAKMNLGQGDESLGQVIMRY